MKNTTNLEETKSGIQLVSKAGTGNTKAKTKKSQILEKAKVHKITKDHEFLHPYSESLALSINYYRKMRRLTQIGLAKKLGVPQSAIANFESGWANPSLVNLLKLADFFDVSITELLTRPSQKTTKTSDE